MFQCVLLVGVTRLVSDPVCLNGIQLTLARRSAAANSYPLSDRPVSAHFPFVSPSGTTSPSQMSELVWGIKNGDLDIVKDYVEREEIDLNQDIDGRPPLLYAADYGQQHVIEYLVSKGANINAKDKHGISALLAAIWEGHTVCVRTLLDKGADKNGTTPEGISYLEAADKAEIKALLQSN